MYSPLRIVKSKSTSRVCSPTNSYSAPTLTVLLTTCYWSALRLLLYCIRIRRRGGIYGKIWLEPKGFTEGILLGLRLYFTVYPSSRHNTDARLAYRGFNKPGLHRHQRAGSRSAARKWSRSLSELILELFHIIYITCFRYYFIVKWMNRCVIYCGDRSK